MGHVWYQPKELTKILTLFKKVPVPHFPPYFPQQSQYYPLFTKSKHAGRQLHISNLHTTCARTLFMMILGQDVPSSNTELFCQSP